MLELFREVMIASHHTFSVTYRSRSALVAPIVVASGIEGIRPPQREGFPRIETRFDEVTAPLSPIWTPELGEGLKRPDCASVRCDPPESALLPSDRDHQCWVDPALLRRSRYLFTRFLHRGDARPIPRWGLSSPKG